MLRTVWSLNELYSSNYTPRFVDLNSMLITQLQWISRYFKSILK